MLFERKIMPISNIQALLWAIDYKMC